jgi:hypothetical protein
MIKTGPVSVFLSGLVMEDLEDQGAEEMSGRFVGR